MNRFTLSEQFFRDQATAAASGGLSTVLNRLSLVARMLAKHIDDFANRDISMALPR